MSQALPRPGWYHDLKGPNEGPQILPSSEMMPKILKLELSSFHCSPTSLSSAR